jgi:hypothetical protein
MSSTIAIRPSGSPSESSSVDRDLVPCAARHLVDQPRVRRPVIRVRDLLAGESGGLLDRAADDIGHPAVDAHQSPFERQMGDAERGLSEHRLEVRGLPARFTFGDFARARKGRDEQGDAREQRGADKVGAAPPVGLGPGQIEVDRDGRQGQRAQGRPESGEPCREDDRGERGGVGARGGGRPADGQPHGADRQEHGEGVASQRRLLSNLHGS